MNAHMIQPRRLIEASGNGSVFQGAFTGPENGFVGRGNCFGWFPLGATPAHGLPLWPPCGQSNLPVVIAWNIWPPAPLGYEILEDADMGELLDALNAADAGGAAPDEPKSTVDQAAEAFQRASRRVGEAVDAARQPDMPFDVLTRLVRQAPLQSLAVAFVVGVIVARR